jgi:hypothetical protein
VASALRSGGVVEACGSSALEKPTTLLAFSGKACLGCQDTGLLGRRLIRRANKDQLSMWFVVPARDSSLVCDFLARERVRATIVAIPEGVYSWSDTLFGLVYASIDPDYRVKDSVLARDADHLMTALSIQY